MRIGFELPSHLMAGTYRPELKGKPFGVSLTLKQSLHPSSKMRKMLRGWRGKDFTPDELKAFSPQKLLGVACRLTLVESSDGQYVNIDSIAPLGKGEKIPKQVNPSTFFSLDPDEFDLEVYNSLGEKTREKIAASPEFRALESGDGEQHDAPTDEPPSEPEDPNW